MTQRSNGFDWDDLKPLLAVARHGSTLAAGRALGMDQSTVQRRLAELERRLGQPLVQRHATGTRLTAVGQELLPYAEAVERAAQAFERHAVALVTDTVGTIRVTCPEPIVNRIVQAGLIDRFQARHPSLRVQFVMSDKYVDLLQGEADVALRSGDTDDDELIGRKIADSLWAVYASRGYLERHGKPASIEALAGHALVGFDESLTRHRVALWLRKVAPDATLAARSSSVLGLIYSVKAGLGVGPLPLSLGDAEPDLVQVLGPVPDLCREWRLLTTRELRRTPRVAAFFDFVVEELETLKPILTG